MAYYAAVVSLVQLLKEMAHPNHPYHNSILEKQQIHISLYEKFNLLKELLDGYSPKGHKKESADILESRIREASYHAQDVIESHIHTEKKSHVVKRFSSHLVSAFQPQIFDGLTLDNIVEKVKEEVDSIVQELMKIKVESHKIHEHVQLKSYTSARSVGGSNVQAPNGRNAMVGFEEHLTTIKAQLCGESSRREAISIVGMGGLGKTTLARSIFDDKLIHDRFDCCAWVTVSQDYHLGNILLAIADSLNIKRKLSEQEELLNNKRELNEEDEISLDQKRELREPNEVGLLIYQHLKGRRYLIVMDDMWEAKVWDDMKRIFPNDNNGSRVIITTRLLDVANYANSTGFSHQLQILNEDQSWDLFSQKVLCPPKLEDIGRSIAKYCQGLPLAIVVVAGLLSKVSKTRDDWEEIARDVSSVVINQNDKHFSNILALSYSHLPHHLKPCFLYLGGFPKNQDIHVSMLIRLWVAEGFLNPIATKSLEEVGEEYLKDLVNRNLVSITKVTPSGKFRHCNVHDLLRDLCSQRAHFESFCHCLHKKDDFHQGRMGNVSRFNIQMWKGSLFRKYKKEHASQIRTVLFFDKDSYWRPFLSAASDFKLLRVLDTGRRRTSKFPKVVVDLLHLRYLALHSSQINIPPSIFKLQNLQTLVVHIVSDEVVISLPSEIWEMPHLRHVLIDRMILPPIPSGKFRITDGFPLLGNLQTLKTVQNFRFTGDIVEMIPNLKKLKVLYTHKSDKSWEELGLNNLVHLHQLETLVIEFRALPFWLTNFHRGVSLPENFAFPSTLIKLSFKDCRLPWQDMRVVGSLPNLQILKLRGLAFIGEEWEPVEGDFLKLKFLLMKRLDSLKYFRASLKYFRASLKYWRAENAHFPCLEQLHIRECFELEEIPSEIGDISTLQLIEVRACSSSLKSSALKIQEEQRDLGNDDLHVRVYDYENFW